MTVNPAEKDYACLKSPTGVFLPVSKSLHS